MQPRYEALDVLRGYALFGILLVNYEAFAMPAFADWNYRVTNFPAPADMIVAWLTQLFCDGKFILIFSFLFGYGAQNQLGRPDLAETEAVRRFRRRLAALFVLGVLHTVLLFPGDILTAYAIVGLALVPLRAASTHTLWRVAAFGWMFSILAEAAAGYIMGIVTVDAASVAQELATFRDGPYGQMVIERATMAPMLLVTAVVMGPQLLGAFAVGMIASRERWFSDLTGEAPRWRRVLRRALPVALVGNAAYTALWHWAAVWEDPGALAIALAGRGLFPPLGSAVYVAAIAVLLTRPVWRARLAFFAPLGRMSLSTYIGESILCGFLFMSYGLGLFGETGPARSVALMVLVYAVLAVFSRYWLARHAIGPLEFFMRAFVERRASA